MEDKVKKYCSFCEKKFGAKYNFCPECGRALEIVHKVDLKKSLEPYLKGTGFTIDEYRDGSQRFGWFRGDDINKDSQKIVKRFVKNKPEFLIMTAKISDNFGKLEFAIDLEGKEGQFNGWLYLPVNKVNIALVLCLVDRENAVKLVDKCQYEMDSQEKRIKENMAAFKRYKDLKKRLALREEE